MSPAAIWLAGGLVLCGAEMLLPGVFLLWVGLAAMGTGGVAAAAALGWHGQLGVFVGLTAVLVGLAAVRLRQRPGHDRVNAPEAGLVGATCHALLFQSGEGRVSLRDGTWPARVADGCVPQPGEALRVVGLDGTTLLVTRGLV